MKKTRKDVAEYAGVSEQTVSYVLNGTRKFSAELEKKVFDAVKALDYHPDMVARGLRLQKTNTVALLIQDLVNPIFAPIIQGFQKNASEQGYAVVIADIKSCHNVDTLINTLIARKIDGVYITLFEEKYYYDITRRFIEEDIKVVLGNKNYLCDGAYYSAVDFDSGVRNIVDYLVKLGHKKIVYLSGLDIGLKIDDRYNAFVSQVKKYPDISYRIVENDDGYETTIETGIKMTEKLLSQTDDFTAIITTNDLMAFGAMECLQRVGKKIPQDVSVFGIDNNSYAKYVNPPLTTIGYDCVDLGKQAFDVLVDMINNKSTTSREILTKIIERKSCKKII